MSEGNLIRVVLKRTLARAEQNEQNARVEVERLRKLLAPDSRRAYWEREGRKGKAADKHTKLIKRLNDAERTLAAHTEYAARMRQQLEKMPLENAEKQIREVVEKAYSLTGDGPPLVVHPQDMPQRIE